MPYCPSRSPGLLSVLVIPRTHASDGSSTPLCGGGRPRALLTPVSTTCPEPVYLRGISCLLKTRATRMQRSDRAGFPARMLARHVAFAIQPWHQVRTTEAVARYRSAVRLRADVPEPRAHRKALTWYPDPRVDVPGRSNRCWAELKQGKLHIDPCVPRHWPRYEARLRTERAEFHIVVENPDGVNRGVRAVEVDGTPATGDIPLADATGAHDIRVLLGDAV